MIPEEKLVANPSIGKKDWRLSRITCGEITRALRVVRNLKGKVYVVGGIITEGETLRDIDVVVTNVADIPKIKKALGKFAKRAHFLLQKEAPPATEYLTVTGKEPRSVNYGDKGKRIPKFEYAGPA